MDRKLIAAKIVRVAVWVATIGAVLVGGFNISAASSTYDSLEPVPISWAILGIWLVAGLFVWPIANNLPLAIIAGHPGWAWRTRRNLQAFARGGPSARGLLNRTLGKMVPGILAALVAMFTALWVNNIMAKIALLVVHVVAVTFLLEAGPMGLRERMMRAQESTGQKPT